MSTSPPLPPSSPAKKSSQELPVPPPLVPQPQSRERSLPAEPAQPEGEIVAALPTSDDVIPDTQETQTQQPAQKQPSRDELRTPEPQTQRPRANGHFAGHYLANQTSPSTPGHIPIFDWEDFEARYEKALADANGEETALLAEFDRLVKVRNLCCCSLDL